MAAVIDPPTETLGTSATANASIDAYLGAGNGMATIMGLTMIVCAVLVVLIAVAWAIGMLPGAIKLF